VKNRFHIKPLFSVLPLIALGLLILLSPCKVRNYIQWELGVSQTQTLNKSQSVFSSLSCAGFEISTSEKSIYNKDLKVSKTLHKKVLTFELPDPNYYKESKVTLPLDIQQISEIPLYILYKNLRVYS